MELICPIWAQAVCGKKKMFVVFYLRFGYFDKRKRIPVLPSPNMSISDTIGAAGYDRHGNAPMPYDNGDPAMQQLQTSRAKVDLDQCLKRIKDAMAIEDPSRVIGGANVALQNYDPRTNMYKADIALVYKGDTDDMNFDYMGHDGRPTVFSSLAGFVVPESVQTDTDFRRMFRPIGIILLDSLIENAQTGQAPHYGNTIVTGGSMGGSLHVVPEKITAGDWLWADIGPLNNDARQEWKKEFRFNQSTMRDTSEKAVLRPWNPYGGFVTLSDALADSIIAGLSGNPLDMHLNPSKYGVDPAKLNPSLATGSALKQGILGAIWMGVAILEENGYLKIFDDAAKITEQPSTKFDKTASNGRTFLAQRLGLIGKGGDEDQYISNFIAGASWQPFVEDAVFADAVDISKALPTSDAHKIQNESMLRVATAITDAYYENASLIVAKSTKNSKQGGKIDYVVCP